jgi:hypothetical protein
LRSYRNVAFNISVKSLDLHEYINENIKIRKHKQHARCKTFTSVFSSKSSTECSLHSIIVK